MKVAWWSWESDAATVIACGTRAGETLHASTESFPAATTVVTPSWIIRWRAVSSVGLETPPRLRLATAGAPAPWWAVIQSIPVRRSESVPLPSQPRMRTGTMVAPFATPYVLPAIVPAMCVPCPWQSRVPRPSASDVQPAATRPPNSTLADTPESTT